MPKILSGSELVGFIKERQAKQVRGLRQAYGITPRLAIVTDSHNPVIELYMRLKERYGEDILVETEIIHAADETELSRVITSLNQRDDVQGIIVQLPLKNPQKTDEIIALVAPEKDVDGLRADSSFTPATPLAIQWLLAGYNIEPKGKNVAIIGRGRLVGAPLEKLWRRSGVRVAVFEKGDDLQKLSAYDLVVSATGVTHIIDTEMIKSGAIVVDAGVAVEDGVVCGDVAPALRQRDDLIITPEKGGVGPLTVAALFDNVITACLRRAGKL